MAVTLFFFFSLRRAAGALSATCRGSDDEDLVLHLRNVNEQCRKYSIFNINYA
jgi:hypothetical protein